MVAFLVEGKFTANKTNLCVERSPRYERERNLAEQVGPTPKDDSNDNGHPAVMLQPCTTPALGGGPPEIEYLQSTSCQSQRRAVAAIARCPLQPRHTTVLRGCTDELAMTA
jgi:hypothetical protein